MVAMEVASFDFEALWEAGRRALDRTALSAQQAPFWLLALGHCLSVADAMRDYTPFWLVSWLLGFCAAFGGGSLSALLLQAPSAAAVALLARNQVGLIYTGAWWAFNYFPLGLVRRTYDALPPLGIAARLCRAVLRATTVVHRVNAAVKLHPGVVAAPICLGTLAGCGGKLIVDAFSHCAGYRTGPNELSHPGIALRSAALGACLQYLLVHVAGLLSAQQGLGLIMTLYAAHSLAADLTGRPCDYTAPLGRLFHLVTLIPEPGKAASAPGAQDAKPAPRPATPGPPDISPLRLRHQQQEEPAEAAGKEGAALQNGFVPAPASGGAARRTRARRRAAVVAASKE